MPPLYAVMEGLVLIGVVGLIASIVWQTIEIRRAQRVLGEHRDRAIHSIEALSENLKARERDRAAGPDPTPPEDRVETGRPFNVVGMPRGSDRP